MTYTWDINVNLGSDGATTYTYDHADRPVTPTQGSNSYVDAFNGLGNWLRQSPNGVPTTYIVDLNAGLTQVLADGSNFSLYGTSRIEEKQGGGWGYHVPDALGSVRQLANATRAVTLARSHAPLGYTFATAGAGVSAF